MIVIVPSIEMAISIDGINEDCSKGRLVSPKTASVLCFTEKRKNVVNVLNENDFTLMVTVLSKCKKGAGEVYIFMYCFVYINLLRLDFKSDYMFVNSKFSKL